MPNIEIPMPDLRVEFRQDFDWSNTYEENEVTFFLKFGRHTIFEKMYTIPKYDYEDYAFNDARDEFDKYVAARLGRLFT